MEEKKGILSLRRLEFSQRKPIVQTASFTDRNRGERPNLTAATNGYLLRAMNNNLNDNGDDTTRNYIVWQLFDGTRMTKKPMCQCKSKGELVDSLFPVGANLFGAVRDDGMVRCVDYYRVDTKQPEMIQKCHRWKPSKPIGFEADPVVVISSYQHFYEPENRTLCMVGGELQSYIFDVETSKLLHSFRDLGKPFLKQGPYFHAAGETCNTIDLRQRYRNETASRLGFSDKISSNFLLPLHSTATQLLSCKGTTATLLPRGILSTESAPPHWGTWDAYHAGIFSGHYLASTHQGRVVAFHPRSSKSVDSIFVGHSQGAYFGASPHLVYDAHTEFWL